MASTNFTAGTVVASSWLNDVNSSVYSNGDAVSVNSYAGVDATGSADSAAAINTAIAAASAAGIKILRFPGTYKVNSVLNLASNMAYDITGTINLTVTDVGLLIPANATNVHIDGKGTGKIAGVCSRAISSVNSSTVTNVRIENLDISGATLVGASYTNGIFLDGANRVWILNNYLHGNGLGASTATGNGDITVYAATNSYVCINSNVCTSTSVGFGIVTYNATEVHIESNTVNGPVCGSSNNNGYGILLYSSVAGTCKRAVIANNIVENTGGSGIYCADVTNVTVANNVLFNIAQTQTDGGLPVGGVSLNGVTNGVASGNVIDTSGKAGVVSANGVRVSIVGGSAVNCSGPGYYLRGTGDGTVVSGVVAENNAYNIWSDGTAKAGVVIENVTSRFSKTTFRGIELGNVSGSRVTGVSSNNARSGLVILAGSNNTVSITTLDNGTDAANTYDGIGTSSNATKFVGCRSGNTSGSGQRYGINSTGNYDTIQNNDLTRNQTDGYSISGTNVMKNGNRLSTSATPGTTQGSGVLVAGTVTITTDEIRSGDTVLLERFTAGGTQGIVGVSTITNATSFVILSNNAADTSTYTYIIQH